MEAETRDKTGGPVWPQSRPVPEAAPAWTLEVNGSQLDEALATALRTLHPDLPSFRPTPRFPEWRGSCWIEWLPGSCLGYTSSGMPPQRQEVHKEGPVATFSVKWSNTCHSS